MRAWIVRPPYQNIEAFQTLKKAFGLKGTQITTGPLGATSRVICENKPFYVKLYRQAGKGIRRWIGRSRLRGEWKNLLLFEKWAIPSAPPVAFGMEKSGPFFRCGAVITAALPETDDLAALAKNNDSRLKNPAWVSSISKQLAAATRAMHQKKFAHGDLKWRNLLVTHTDPPQLYLIDCPAGRFWPWPFLQYRKNKDIACLDKVAKHVLSRTQRLRFFLDYLGKDRLERKSKKQLRNILRFLTKRTGHPKGGHSS